MKRWLYLFRHGQTHWNLNLRFQGHTDIPLNDKGLQQAEALISVFKPQKIEAFFSSDLQRAMHTAEIIVRRLGLPLHIHHDLREGNIGYANGLTREQILRTFGTELADRWRSAKDEHLDARYPSGESGREIMNRGFRALNELLDAYPHYQRIGVCSHGGIIRRVIQKLLPEREECVSIPNGSLYVLQVDETKQGRNWKVLDYVPLCGDFT